MVIENCLECNGTICSNDIGYECAFCNNKYHKRCTTKETYCDTGSSYYNTLFICQICEKEVNMS